MPAGPRCPAPRHASAGRRPPRRRRRCDRRSGTRARRTSASRRCRARTAAARGCGRRVPRRRPRRLSAVRELPQPRAPFGLDGSEPSSRERARERGSGDPPSAALLQAAQRRRRPAVVQSSSISGGAVSGRIVRARREMGAMARAQIVAEDAARVAAFPGEPPGRAVDQPGPAQLLPSARERSRRAELTVGFDDHSPRIERSRRQRQHLERAGDAGGAFAQCACGESTCSSLTPDPAGDVRGAPAWLSAPRPRASTGSRAPARVGCRAARP